MELSGGSEWDGVRTERCWALLCEWSGVFVVWRVEWIVERCCVMRVELFVVEWIAELCCMSWAEVVAC